ncbi:glycosyltransferase family 2 protein [Pseudoflavitalea sp. G-6-1-2]|uniref:glycosyltransferase family 2 protein n=1 Tax=Pseudoflavitalea sp. G-6-1-2 TaxID=2728841 RepID=UPI00146C28B3|nr:glycosyltransferase family 2 protein [Pseudoflavitalea sp. G-6-1-2]NML19821.1 glycosyltransferase family 2 protein [Pseudoflavitalea sp. G-6-1-2]
MAVLSVVIITFNEEDKLRACLESVRTLADEIVVVDSLSTDNTEKIAKEFGVRFVSQPFLGYIEQKNFALQQATHEMVLSLDADEVLDEKLQASMLAEKQKDFPFDGYTMNRTTSYAGKWIRHGSWYPDVKLRLFDRRKSHFGGTNPHDRIIESEGYRKKHLKGDILHSSFESFTAHIAQLNRFTTIQAAALNKEGKKGTFAKLWINPIVAFVNGYIFKGGFRDGTPGLIIAVTVAYQTFAKYAKLRLLQRNQQ